MMTDDFAVVASQGIKVEPIPVEITNHPHPKKFEVRAAFRSFVLSAANPYLQIAGFDPLRECIWISGVANPIVVAGSVSQASDPANTAASIVNPNGRYIPGGAALQATEWRIDGMNEIWIATGTYPTIVGVSIIRKVPEQ